MYSISSRGSALGFGENMCNKFILYGCIIISDFPGVPRDVFGVRLQNINNDTCLIASFWRRPDNSPHAGAMDYMVSMGGNLLSAGPRLAYFVLSNCSSVNISVGATNLCGRGPMSDNVTLDPIPCEDSSVCSIFGFGTSSAPLMSKSLITMWYNIMLHVICTLLLPFRITEYNCYCCGFDSLYHTLRVLREERDFTIANIVAYSYV